MKTKWSTWILCLLYVLVFVIVSISALFVLSNAGAITFSDKYVEYDYTHGVKKTTEISPGGNWFLLVVLLIAVPVSVLGICWFFYLSVKALSLKEGEVLKITKKGDSAVNFMKGGGLAFIFLSIPGLIYFFIGNFNLAHLPVIGYLVYLVPAFIPRLFYLLFHSGTLVSVVLRLIYLIQILILLGALSYIVHMIRNKIKTIKNR
ncbi:hypothetical protein JW935_11655 [candidate division KSB1 bacterium]|nr:hypothetical protein [candidate division KSB1 bacterium]